MGDIEQMREFFDVLLSHWIWLSLSLVAGGLSLWRDLWKNTAARIGVGIFALFCFFGALAATISDQYVEMADVHNEVRESVGLKPR